MIVLEEIKNHCKSSSVQYLNIKSFPLFVVYFPAIEQVEKRDKKMFLNL